MTLSSIKRHSNVRTSTAPVFILFMMPLTCAILSTYVHAIEVDAKPTTVDLIDHLKNYRQSLDNIALRYERITTKGPLLTDDTGYIEQYCKAFARAQVRELQNAQSKDYSLDLESNKNYQNSYDWISKRAEEGVRQLHNFDFELADNAWTTRVEGGERGFVGREFGAADGICKEIKRGPQMPLQGEVDRDAVNVDKKLSNFPAFAWFHFLQEGTSYTKHITAPNGYILQRYAIRKEQPILRFELHVQFTTNGYLVPTIMIDYYKPGRTTKYLYKNYEDMNGKYLPRMVERIYTTESPITLPALSELENLKSNILDSLLPYSSVYNLALLEVLNNKTQADLTFQFRKGTEVRIKKAGKTLRKYVAE